jgi:hypothetical protein
MDATAVFRLISLIPDRPTRAQSGSVFSQSEAAASRQPDRMSYLTKFLHWLGPLDPMTKEDQQILGVRTSGGRPMMAGEEVEVEEEALEALDFEADELEETQPTRLPDAGTQIAPTSPPSTVGGESCLAGQLRSSSSR